MNTFPALPLAAGRCPTVDSGGLHCPPDKLLYPVHVFVPATVAKPLVSAVGFFHELVAPQYQRSWFVVSMYNIGGAQLPDGAPVPVRIAFVVVLPTSVRVPGAWSRLEKCYRRSASTS